MFRVIFCAVPAFNLVEPAITSPPTTSSIAISAAPAMALSRTADDADGQCADLAGVADGTEDERRPTACRDADDGV